MGKPPTAGVYATGASDGPEAGDRSRPTRLYDGPMSRAPPPPAAPATAASPSRIGAIAESATLKVDAKAKALKAEGRPVIGFGAGEPDFPTPDYIVEAAVEACRDPKNHRYTPAGGLPELKKAIAEKTLRDSGLRGRAEPGAGHQRRQAGHLRGVRRDARPGRRGDRAGAVLDDVPRGDPARRRRRRSRCSPTRPRTTRSPSSSSRRPAPTRTKVLLFVSPSNPTGAVYTADEIRAIGQWVEDHDLWVLTDEIYEHLVYDDVDTGSMPVLCPFLAGQLRGRQRRRQDLRDDRLAGRLDDRPGRPGQGRHQPAVARHLQRRQRRPAGRARRGLGRPVRGRRR